MAKNTKKRRYQPSKHGASKTGFDHQDQKRAAKVLKPGYGTTNHERVIAGRARRMGISVKEYRRLFRS